jgi:hypothetical protein
MIQLLVPIFVPAIGAALAASWAAGGAPVSAPAQRPAPRCFRAAEVNGFTPRGNDQVDVQVGANRHYRLTLAGACPDVDWSFRLGIRTTGGSSWICQGADAEIIVPSPNGRQSCLVSDVRALSPAEVAASRRRR